MAATATAHDGKRFGLCCLSKVNVRYPIRRMLGRFYTIAVVLLPSPSMHAVVTGAAGFIGSHLTAELTGRGYRVTGIDREPGPSRPNRHITMDLADDPRETRLLALLSTADVVFHLAARPGVRGSGPHIERLRWRDNVVASANVLTSTRPDTHLVVTSSSSVYGGASMGDAGLIPSAETDPFRPVGGYARSKVEVEQMCRLRGNAGGSVTVVRPFTVAGEGQRSDMAFATWLDALRRGMPIEIHGSRERSRDVTDVRDVVEGLIRSAEGRLNETINVGTGVSHRLVDMARALVYVTGLAGGIVHVPVSAEEVPATLADTTKCARLLGFVPTTDLHDVVERLVAASPVAALAVS